MEQAMSEAEAKTGWSYSSHEPRWHTCSRALELKGLSRAETEEVERLAAHYQVSRTRMLALAVRNWLLNPEVKVVAPLRNPAGYRKEA